MTHWKQPWHPLDSNETTLQRELENEVSPAHPLWQKGAVVIGRREDKDDVAVRLNDGRVACVHLTWQGKVDAYPDKYPSTTFYNSIDSLFEGTEFS
jgi:hypothetical protein